MSTIRLHNAIRAACIMPANRLLTDFCTNKNLAHTGTWIATSNSADTYCIAANHGCKSLVMEGKRGISQKNHPKKILHFWGGLPNSLGGYRIGPQVSARAKQRQTI
jgi:hypothetical protein